MSIGTVCPSVPRGWLPTPAYTLCSRRLRSYRATRQHMGCRGGVADFVKNGAVELGFMRPRNECTELFAEHTYSPEHTYSECLSSCSSPVQPIHPEQGLPPSTRIDGWHKDSHCPACKLPSLQVGSTRFSLNELGSLCKLCSFVWKHTIAPVGSYQLIFAWSD